MSNTGTSPILKIIAAIIFLLIIAAATILMRLSSLNANLENKRTALRDAGQPVTLEELDAWYPRVSNANNAALLYAQAFAQLEAADPGGARIQQLLDLTKGIDRIALYPPSFTSNMNTILLRLEPTLITLDRATRAPNARYPIDMTQGIGVELPHLDNLRRIARVSYLVSEAALLQGDHEAAVKRHITILHIGNTLALEPLLISQLVRIAIDTVALESLERLLSHTQFEAIHLDALEKAYAKAYRPDALHRAMIGERCTQMDLLGEMLHVLLLLDRKDENTLLMKLAFLRYRLKIFKTFDDRHARIELYNSFDHITPGTDPNWPEIVHAVRTCDKDEPESSILPEMLNPSLHRAHLSFVNNIATIRLARTAIAIERFRLVHDTPPDELALLVPGFLKTIPEDPYDGAPLRYRRNTGGYTIYSIYRDVTDDGGKPQFKNEEGVTLGDFVFTITR